MFDHNAAAGKRVVLLFLFGCEGVEFAFFVRCLAVGMLLGYALIARVAQQFERGTEGQAAGFEQGKIMSFARAHRHAHDFLGELVNHNLSFLGVTLFLAGVEAALFFWGRSMRCSLASTTTTVRFKDPSCSAFLPGR